MTKDIKITHVLNAFVKGDIASFADENGDRWDLYVRESAVSQPRLFIKMATRIPVQEKRDD